MSEIAEQARAGVNAYADIAAADRWFAARQSPGWAKARPAKRHAVLIRAADWIDTQFRFRGRPSKSGQQRAWPRTGAGVAPASLPLPVQTAYFELALALLDGDEAAERLLGLRGAVRSERVGGLAVEYAVSGRNGGRDGGRLHAMLAPYLRSGVATRIVRT